MEVNFVKMEGLGNDFILLDDRKGSIAAHRPYFELAATLCDRHFGIGADGIILILNPGDDGHDICFRIYNSDGSEAQMCGNGMRCFAGYLYETGIMSQKRFRVDTRFGTVIPEVMTDDRDRVVSVRVDMGEPVLACADIPFDGAAATALDETLRVGEVEYRISALSMGNPHAVIFVDDPDLVDLERLGRAIETHPRFPDRTNVEFVRILKDHEMSMRVWERGAGLTLACGTGACAVLVAACLTGRTGDRALIHLPGGDLDIHWDRTTNHVFKTGPARLVFEGRIKM